MNRLPIASMFVLFVWPAVVDATTIRRMSFDEEFLSADLIAVVECETAGAIFCRVRILDSIKGPPAGSSIIVRSQPDYWGPAFPATECGSKYLLVAYRTPPGVMMSTTSGAPIPSWWRNLPIDFRTPLGHGWHRASDETIAKARNSSRSTRRRRRRGY